LSVLQSDKPIFDKAKACQQLAIIGTKNAVPVLAQLLADEHSRTTRALPCEPLPDPSVDEALRASLGQLQGSLLVGVVNTIGMRRRRASHRLAQDAAAKHRLRAVAGAAPARWTYLLHLQRWTS